MKNSSKTISGLDIQREYLSVAQYSQDENAVQLIAIQPISLINGGDIGEQLSGELKELKSKFKFTSPDIICSIPSENAIVKHLSIDSADDNPEDSLEWELGQQVVGPLDEYVFDFQDSGISKDSTKNYLAVAYRKQTINSLSSALKGIRLNPIVVDLDIFALINVFEANYPEKIETPAIIFHAEKENTKLILTTKGTFIDYECIDLSNQVSNPADFADKSNAEIEKILSLNSSVLENNPANIFYTGSLMGQSQYSDALVNKIGNGELLDPFRKISCRVGVDEEQLKLYSSQLAVAVGLAYRGNN